MTEKLLQFIWKMQLYNKLQLQTFLQDRLQIINAGYLNQHQGPDFLHALIKINNTVLAGSIELHIKSSDWVLHRHDGDANYNNVVLHVVWKHDKEKSNLPVLELQNLVPKLMLQRYEILMEEQEHISCYKHIKEVPEIVWEGWKERVLAERLQHKAAVIQKAIEESNRHWEEVFWWQIARNFGITVNADAFESMARSVPIKLLTKHKGQLNQLEALLLGQCGLLSGRFTDSYAVMLQREYHFLKNKYKLSQIFLPIHFLRMRPSNFPTVRLAQLAALINQSSHLFSLVLKTAELKKLSEQFNVTANDYWHYHYRLEELAEYKPKVLGEQMVNNLLINTIVPMLFAYGEINNDNNSKAKALDWLQQIKAERNAVTKLWTRLSIRNVTAADSQALIGLYKNYCMDKKCLQCSAGAAILKSISKTTS